MVTLMNWTSGVGAGINPLDLTLSCVLICFKVESLHASSILRGHEVKKVSNQTFYKYMSESFEAIVAHGSVLLSQSFKH